MATIRKRISTKADAAGNSRILLRVTVSRTTQVRIKTNIYVPHRHWNPSSERITIGKATGPQRTELIESAIRLNELEAKILKLCTLYPPETFTSEWLTATLQLCTDIPMQQLTPTLIDQLADEQQHPRKYATRTFFELMDDYLADTPYSRPREKNFRVLIRALQRYETFVRLSSKKRRHFTLTLDTLDKDTLTDIETYLRNEHTLPTTHPTIYKKITRTIDRHRPKPRGNNTICALFNKLRAFLNWCYENNKTTNRPFIGYKGATTEVYGTPYYITLEERNHIADYDLTAHPHLATQRDIFIFQCCIGCRVSDLMRLTPTDIIDGEIHYIPHKTKSENPTTVHVPLNQRAKALIHKYHNIDKRGRLFPYTTPQKYNYAIKEIFRHCGITRRVTILNPTTGKEEKRPICDVASSHMARRCFVGNLYKQWTDPSLICPMSGHKAGSAAFARYREIDKELRLQVVKSIE